MAYFRCTTGGSGKGNTLVVTCADDLAGATITCTNGTKTYRKTCPSTAPYEVTFYGLEAGTWTVSATVSGNTYTTTVVITDYEAELGGFNWKAWVDLSQNYTSSDFTDLDDLLSDETAIRELMTIHACVDYLAEIAAASADVEQIIENDYCAKWINLRDYALDTLYANAVIKGYMDTADKYGYGEWALVGQVPKMTSNTAPYGQAITNAALSDTYAAWKAFDNTTDSQWLTTSATTNNYVGYTFQSAIRPSKVKVDFYVTIQSGYTSPLRTFKVQGSNDGFASDIHDLETFSVDTKSANTEISIDVDIASNTTYSSLRIYCTDTLHVSYQWSIGVESLQFYTWGPKGNVPVMTADSAPYGSVFCSPAADTANNYNAYKSFDKQSNTKSLWRNISSGTTVSLGYHFTNPVIVKAVGFTNIEDVAYGPSQYIVRGSNDGTNYTNIKTIANTGAPNTEVITELENDTAYLYYDVLMTGKGNSNLLQVRELQFYGRELSVSVPVMTSNTVPYGTAFAKTEGTYGTTTFPAYKAFDGTLSSWWHTGENGYDGTNNTWLGYEFTIPTCVKGVLIQNPNDSDMRGNCGDYILQGSDTGNTDDWDDIGSKTRTNNTNAGITYDAFDNNVKKYKKWRILITKSASGSYNFCRIMTLQFYGFDYSEKEFEEGTNKKWLYDHGVELVEFEKLTTGNGWTPPTNSQFSENAHKTPNSLYVGPSEVNKADGFGLKTAIDFTPYSLFRFINDGLSGNEDIAYYFKTSKSLVSPVAYIYSGQNKGSGLDVSSLNENEYFSISSINSTARKGEVYELWLE